MAEDLEAKARAWLKATWPWSLDTDGPCERETMLLTILLRSVAAEACKEEREACAAYCLDRADQYDTSSGIWPALAESAEGIAKGEAAEWLRAGETEDLLARVRTMSGFTRPTPKPRDRALAGRKEGT